MEIKDFKLAADNKVYASDIARWLGDDIWYSLDSKRKSELRNKITEIFKYGNMDRV